MKKKLLDFQASISDVVQINPLFSTCKVRVLYTGRNRNMTILTKDSVEKALPTLKNIPIVGEYSMESKDFKGHGGSINLDDWSYVHTTKPYGVVPESATYEWENFNGKDYLTIHGCYLWTGRYEEAYSVIDKGKGQSMEIEVTNGTWVESEDAYRIDNFTFSALCILGDNVQPAFEDASITAYSLDKDSFKKEYTQMLNELKFSLNQEEEVNKMFKEILEKYSITIEDLQAKGIEFGELSAEELEAKIKEVFEVDNSTDDNNDNTDNSNDDSNNDEDADGNGDTDDNNDNDNSDDSQSVDYQAKITELEGQLTDSNQKYETLLSEVKDLRTFKKDIEKNEHESKSKALFSKFQLKDDDVKDLDIHSLTIEEIEEKCYAILGKKLTKKSFSLNNDNNDGGIRLPLGGDNQESKQSSRYGDLFERFADTE